MKVNIKDKKNRGASFQVTAEVKDGENVLATETITAQSVQSLDQQIIRFRNVVAQVQAEFDQVVVGEWTEPEEPARRELSAEEQKQRAIATAEQVFEDEVEKYRDMKAKSELLPDVFTEHMLNLQKHTIQTAWHNVTVAKN